MASNSNIRTNDPTKVPALPRIPADTPPSLRRYLELLEQTTNIRLGRRGDPRDRAITLRELIDSGLAKELATNPFDPNRLGNTGFVQPGTALPDLAVPPPVAGFAAAGAFSTIILTWTYPSYSNHSHTEIWSHTSDSIGDATLVGIQTGRVFTDPVGSGVTRYYWARHVNTDSVVGPFNAAAGTQAQTATDVNHMLGVLSTAIRASELATELSDPIGNLPADTNAAIELAQSKIDVWSSTTAYAVNKIVRAGASDTKLYICIQAVSANSGIALSNGSYWKLYGDYDVLKLSTDTATTAITAINTISSSGNSAAATSIRALNSILYDNPAGTGNPRVSATNLSTMATVVLNDAQNGARASATQLDYLNASYSNPTGSGTVTLAQALETSASEVDGLRGQYTVKIDTNGAVAGFGLAQTATASGNITSEFIVNAERFALISSGTTVTNPTGSHNASAPFIVQGSTDNDFNGTGETVQAGVYMTEAFIRNGSIVSAKIGTLAADKITSGFISADRIDGNSINASKLVLDNSTITSQTIGGVPTVIIKDLGVGNAQISDLNAIKLTAGSLTVYNAAASNTMGKLFTLTSGYVATTAYNTNSTTNMSYASVTSDWHDGNYNNPWHYNNTAGTTMPGLLIDGSASGNNFTIPDVEGDQTHVEVSVHFGTNPVGTFNGDETSFCVCHLQRADSSINNTGAYDTDTQVWGGSVSSNNTNIAIVPRYGVFTASLNPGTWYVWLFAWSRKADTSSSGTHGFSDSFVHVNSFYR